MLPNLATLLAYEHPAVIRAYVRTHQSDEASAKRLFTDMLKYLWLSRKHAVDRSVSQDPALNFVFVMHQEMRDIDNMWHNFILYTRDYTQFCLDYFGEYLHHQPDIAEGKSLPSAEDFSEEMERYLSYVYENLGEATLRDWFAVHV